MIQLKVTHPNLTPARYELTGKRQALVFFFNVSHGFESHETNLIFCSKRFESYLSVRFEEICSQNVVQSYSGASRGHPVEACIGPLWPFTLPLGS